MLRIIETYLRNNWASFDVGPLSARVPLRSLLLTSGNGAHGKIVCLWWRGADALPCLVVKFPRYPRDNDRLEAEYIALQHVHTHLPPDDTHAPRPLGSELLDGVRVTVESVGRGRMLQAYLREHPLAYADELCRLRPFAAWLTSFHARSARPATPAEIQRHVVAPLATADIALGLAAREVHGLTRLRARATRLAADTTLPLVFCHNDAGTPNVLVDQRGCFTDIIDWESGGMGPPVRDLFYFLARYAHETRGVHHGDQPRGFRELFFDELAVTDRPFGPSLVADWLGAYLRDLAVASDWLPVLFGLTWIMHATNERAPHLQRQPVAQGIPPHGKLDTMTAAQTDGTPPFGGHFRAQLRYYLENIDACTALSLAMRAAP